MVLADWLHPDRDGYEAYGSDHHVSCVQLLGGLFARWELRPDGEHAEVAARREEIAGTLAGIAHLRVADLPGIHPPANQAEQEAQRAEMEAVWPWRRLGWQQAIECIGARCGYCRMQWEALRTVLGEIVAEDFHGEDPLPGDVRALVDRAAATYEACGHAWARAGEALGVTGWPAELPAPVAQETARTLANFRAVFRDVEEAG